MAQSIEHENLQAQAVVSEINQPEISVEPLGTTRRVKTDLLNQDRELMEKCIKIAILGISAVGLNIAARNEGNDQLLYLASYSALAPMVAFVCKLPIDGMRHILTENKHSIVDEELGYRADRFVYAGNKLDISGGALEKGDNFYRLQLPNLNFEGEHPTPEQEGAIAKLYAYVLSDFRSSVSARDYQAVAIDIGNEIIQTDPMIKNAPKISRRRLFEGKNVKLLEPSLQAAIFSKEALELISLEPREIFERTVDALEQSVGGKIGGRRLIEELRGLGAMAREQKMEEARRLRIKLDHLFDSEAEGLFNGLPQTYIDRGADSGFIRRKSSTHPALRIIKAFKGDILQQISYTQGDKRTLLRLDRLLEEVISLDSKDRALLLSYTISQMLSSPEMLEEVTRDFSLSREEVLGELKSLGVSVDIKDIYKHSVASAKPRGVPRIVRNALLAATLGGVLITGVGATSEATNLRLPQIAAAEAAKAEASAEAAPTEGGTPAEGQAAESADYNSAQLSSTTETGLSNSVGNHEKPGFPESVPQSHLDWKIETNNLDFFNNGYYITSTASAYKNGEWILNNSLENATLLDSKQLSEKVNQIDKVAGAALTGNMVLDASGSASFKLPVQAATTLYGLIITGIDGNPIDINSYQVYGLADGTFEVKVALGSTNARSAIQIKEVLVESDESVHATQHIPAIDLNKLNEDALNLLKYSDADLWDLSEEVGGDTYSINPSNKNILDQTDGSPESFINAAVKLTGKDCDTANAEFALLSSNLETPDDYYVNMAFGYSGTLGPNGDIGFLDSVSAHAFTVATDGSIIDATPAGAMSDDPMTQQYLANLGKAADSDKEAAWNQQSTNLSNQDSQRKQDLKKQADQENKRRQITLDLELMLGLGLAAGGLSLAPKGAGVLRRNLTSKKINSAVSKVMPGRLRAEELSIKELEEAYRFFNWLSFGGGKNFPADSLVDGFQNAPELLGKMQGGSLSVRRIKEYLRNPKQFEQAAGVTNPRILRQLAKYVIVS